MSFTDYYFELGYNSTLEKVAARKQKDEGMSLGAKLGLGALGAAGLGAGAYFGGDIANALGADRVGDFLNQNITSPVNDALAAAKYGLNTGNLGDAVQKFNVDRAIHNFRDSGINTFKDIRDASGDAYDYLKNLIGSEVGSKVDSAARGVARGVVDPVARGVADGVGATTKVMSY